MSRPPAVLADLDILLRKIEQDNKLHPTSILSYGDTFDAYSGTSYAKKGNWKNSISKIAAILKQKGT